MMGCEHCSHPLWAGIKCSQCGRWYDECRVCGKRGCEECMKAGLKQAWDNYQEALKEFDCPRCGHHCSQPEQEPVSILRTAAQQALEALWFANAQHWHGHATIEKAISSLQAALKERNA